MPSRISAFASVSSSAFAAAAVAAAAAFREYSLMVGFME